MFVAADHQRNALWRIMVMMSTPNKAGAPAKYRDKSQTTEDVSSHARDRTL